MNQSNFFDYIDSQLNVEQLFSVLKKDTDVALNLPIGFCPLLLVKLVEQYQCFFLARDEIEAEAVFESIRGIGAEVLFFPDIDVIPFSNVFPSADKLSDRINTLYQISTDKNRIVIMTIESFLRKIPPAGCLAQSVLTIKTGDTIDPDSLALRLIELSYIREFKVNEPGTFSVRGDIIDVFPPNSDEAYRINLFGNEVESLKLFNPQSQTSIKAIDECIIIPASEFSLKKEIATEGLEHLLGETHMHSHFLKFYHSFSNILDYSKKSNLILYHDNAIKLIEDIQERYAKYTPDDEPELLEDIDNIIQMHSSVKKIKLQNLPVENSPVTVIKNPPEFGEGFSRFVADIENIYLKGGYKIFVLVEYEDLAQRLMNILAKFNPVLTDPRAKLDTAQQLSIMTLSFEHGFEINNGDEKVLVLTESDISGKKRLFRKRIRQIDTIFEDIEDIKEGEYVVHLNYGIGVFKKIERVNVLGKEKDYILLEFAEREKLFVPLEQSNLIGKYVGGITKKPLLDSLGSKSWVKKREKVQKSIEEFAQKLVAIYARRNSMQGHSFAKDTVWQKDFEDRFEYIETPDQVKVIEEIKRDMESVKPMDRLLCGDVGFGKTEVAMRASFKAVMDGQQVAVIAPTTVLVEQHYYTFIERFKGFPVQIDYVSRFTETKDLRRIQRGLEDHKIDILIGTHKLFSEQLKYHQLGLVIIDEEHKFGVNHKEVLKERYPVVDFLSLSATPIPRTLNMAISTIRDISLLETPPDMRIPVETYVSDYSMDIVKYAVENELKRNGQVYFVHNTIKRLSEYAFLIEQMVPSAKTAIGHGQMEEEELDRAFMGFVKGHYNVFVCTTIIDSGLDIPNANTIIISDAHRFGLSQLYQLKGRVGRAKKQGHAYFLYPENKALTENAQKRLFVINEYTNLGAGFNIALKDLEIRGAGNVLGRDQHGNMIAVGYDVYMRLLREEIDKLKGEVKKDFDTLIDLNYDAFIPNDYISDNSTKMEVYKKILSVKSEAEIRKLNEDLVDRFGRVPAEVGAIFEISRLKIKSGELGIDSIIEKGETIEIRFSKYSRVDVVKVMQIKAAGKHEISIKPHEKDKIFYKSFDSNITIKVKRLSSFMDDILEH